MNRKILDPLDILLLNSTLFNMDDIRNHLFDRFGEYWEGKGELKDEDVVLEGLGRELIIRWEKLREVIQKLIIELNKIKEV